MSHTVSIKLRIKEPELLARVARKKGYRVEKRGGSLNIHLPVGYLSVEGEKLSYDSFYSGNRDFQRHLNELVSGYVEELALQTLRQEFSIPDATVIQRRDLKDGSREIKILIP